MDIVRVIYARSTHIHRRPTQRHVSVLSKIAKGDVGWGANDHLSGQQGIPSNDMNKRFTGRRERGPARAQEVDHGSIAGLDGDRSRRRDERRRVRVEPRSFTHTRPG